MSRRVQLAVVLAVCWPCAAMAQANANEAEVDRIFARWTQETPGCAVGVAERGQPVLLKAYGMADLEHDVKNGPDTIFEAGSVSKQFTAAAIALLARDGKLSLDDQVRKYVPELPDYGMPLTIRHMLNHTSGLRDWGSVAEIGGWPRSTRAYTHAHVLDIVSRQSALNFAPGSKWSYSNTGYNLAAVIVERVSGMSFQQFSRARIFLPLGMLHTSWRDDYTRVVKQRAIAYERKDGLYHSHMPFENVVGNGGLLTTVRDLLAWNENFVKPVVGDARLLADMQQPGVYSDGRAHEYGLGLFIGRYKDMPLVSHSGATAGYRAMLSRFPERHLSVALLCNAGNANAPADASRVADVFLGTNALAHAAPPGPSAGTELDAAAAAPDAALLGELAGTYTSVDAEATYIVSLEAGALVARQRTGPALMLAPNGRDAFKAGPVKVLFRRDAQGKVNALSVVEGRVWDMRFEKRM